jgi:hypothetical protein
MEDFSENSPRAAHGRDFSVRAGVYLRDYLLCGFTQGQRFQFRHFAVPRLEFSPQSQ